MNQKLVSIKLVAIVAAATTSLWMAGSYDNIAEAVLSGQSTMEVGTVDCTYELLEPGVERFNPDARKLVPQESDVRVDCRFNASLPEETILAVESGLDLWKGVVTVKAPGTADNETQINGPQDELEVAGGTIIVALEGTTPRGLREETDPWGYRRQLHWAQTFDLIDLELRAPGRPGESVHIQSVQSASPPYIQLYEALDNTSGNASGAEHKLADSLAKSGFPATGLQVLELSGGPTSMWSSNWLWGIIGLVLGIAITGVAWWRFGSNQARSTQPAAGQRPPSVVRPPQVS